MPVFPQMGVEVVTEVLLACYNGEKYLPPLLASLSAQGEKDFRVLMQDDGSRDGTLALLKSQAEADDRFLLTADASPARLRGAIGNFWSLLGQSRGDYTALCDQDDVWHADRLQAGLAAMGEAEARWGRETPLLVHGDARVVDASGRVLHESFFAHQGWDFRAVELPRLLVQNNVTGCTVLMNRPLRELALRCGDPAKMYMHDWFLALTAAAFGHVVCLPRPLVDYRQHGNNEMGASAAGLAERGVRALSARERGKARIALTYRHTRDFAAAYGALLPPAAREIIDRYLALEHRPKPARVWGMLRGGYRMQSPVTRAGQIFFC